MQTPLTQPARGAEYIDASQTVCVEASQPGRNCDTCKVFHCSWNADYADAARTSLTASIAIIQPMLMPTTLLENNVWTHRMCS